MRRPRPSLSVLVLVLALLGLGLALHPTEAHAQRLRGASGTVRSGESRSSSGSSSRSRSDDRSTLGRGSSTVRSGGGRGDSGYHGGWGHGWWRPRRWWQPSVAVVGTPYVHTTTGYRSWSAEPEPEPVLRTMVVPQLEAGYIQGGVGVGTASVRVLLPAPAELHFGYSVYVEPLDDGGIEALALGRFGAAWRVVEEDAVHVRIGGSLRHWHDYLGARFGGDLLAGIELFPFDPLVIGAEGSIGIVGDAWAFEFRGTAGVMIDILELYGGWQHLALEAINGSGGVVLAGPMAGIRLWI